MTVNRIEPGGKPSLSWLLRATVAAVWFPRREKFPVPSAAASSRSAWPEAPAASRHCRLVRNGKIRLNACLMEIYAHPTFQMACRQFDLVADHLQIPASDRERLKFPKRSLTVARSVHTADGKL